MRLKLQLTKFYLSSVRFGKAVIRHTYQRLNSIELKLADDFDRAAHDSAVARTARRYDMTQGEDERYYAKFYGAFIEENITKSLQSLPLRILDLGCGQGRIYNELVTRNVHTKSYLGIDFSPEAIDAANSIEKIFPGNVTEFRREDLASFLNSNGNEEFDLILALEVLYMVPNHEEILTKILKLLSRNGTLILALRTDLYMVNSLLCQGLFSKVSDVFSSNEGAIFDSGVKFNWTDLEGLKVGLADPNRLIIEDAIAIGINSGIPGDPFSKIVRPGLLRPEDQELLFDAERRLGRKYPNGGRYLLVALRRD